MASCSCLKAHFLFSTEMNYYSQMTEAVNAIRADSIFEKGVIMNEYWAFVRTDVGRRTRVTIQADNPHSPSKLLKTLYGESLISQSVNTVQTGNG